MNSMLQLFTWVVALKAAIMLLMQEIWNRVLIHGIVSMILWDKLLHWRLIVFKFWNKIGGKLMIY